MTAGSSETSSRRHLLRELDRLGRSVRLRRGGIALAGSLRPWYRVADPDAVVEAAAADDRDPFWAQDWPSAIAVDRWFDLWSSLCPPAAFCGEALELGCGSGVVATALRLRGLQCLATDAQPQAVLLARINQLANGLPPRTEKLEWSETRDDRRFPLIVAADVVYARESFPPLTECLRRRLAVGGAAVIAEPMRMSGNEFCERLSDEGWQVRQVRPPRPEEPAVRFIVCQPPGS